MGIMRRHEFAVTILLLLVGAVAASAQSLESSAEYPYGLDPYKPSDAALLRDYGDTLVAQTPLAELRKLDPYKPSHAALLRDLGGAIPLWGTMWYPSPVPLSLSPFPTEFLAPRALRRSRWMQSTQPRDDDRTIAPPVGIAAPTSMATLRPPENNDGVWIVFEQQKWISAGRSIPFDSASYIRIGEYDRVPVFKRAGANEDVVYLLLESGSIAPYRLKR
jgi:hypothetical protein